MISRDFLIRRIQTPIPRDAPVVPVSLPVTSFGDPNTARIATIGINPSSAEFCSKPNVPLSAGNKRFVDREDLGIGPFDIPTQEQADRVLEGNHNYFKTGNAYKWFDYMQKWVLTPLGASYTEGTAVHLDLGQWATEPIWDKIEKDFNRIDLIVNDREFLNQILRHGEFDLVVLNGSTVLKHMFEMKLFYSVYSEKLSFTKTNGKLTSVTFNIGLVNSTPAIGWSANIPDSRCGDQTRKVVSEWITAALELNLLGRELGENVSLRNSENVHHCPLCNAELLKLRRYPRYLCPSCADHIVDGDGRRVRFTDHDNGEGLTMHYVNGQSPDIHTEMPSVTGYPHVWVDGVECEVRVAHFGGVVIQTLA